jgi:hypothetical protein
LGHGYFAELKPTGNVIDYYRARVRPVLQSHLKGYRDQDLANIDEKVDQLFNTATAAPEPSEGARAGGKSEAGRKAKTVQEKLPESE